MQRQARIRIAEIRPSQLRDAAHALAHGVAVKVERTGDGIEAPVGAQVLLERAAQILVAVRVGRQRSKHALAELADLGRGTTQDETVGTELVEVRCTAFPRYGA